MNTWSNIEILQFIMGWQGGTIKQTAEALKKESDSEGALFTFGHVGRTNSVHEWEALVLEADKDRMGSLMRIAQQVCQKKWQEVYSRDKAITISKPHHRR